MFLPTSTCATLPIMVFPKGKQGFLRKAIFDVLSMLNFNLMPTWLHFASQNRPKIHENVDPMMLPIMHSFSFRFWTSKTSLLGPNLEPSWLSRRSKRPPRPPPRGLQIELPDRYTTTRQHHIKQQQQQQQQHES